VNRRCLYGSWKCSCSPAGSSQANFNWYGSTDHAAKIQVHRLRLLTSSPWWACKPGLKSLFSRFCCAVAAQPIVWFALLTAAWTPPRQPERSQRALPFDQNDRRAAWCLGPAPSFALWVLRCRWGEMPHTLRASGSVSSQGWDLFLAVTWHKRKCYVKLLLSFPIRVWIPSLLICISRKNSWFFWVGGRIQISWKLALSVPYVPE